MTKYKTSWSTSTVTRNANKEGMRESDWILAKQREYERASGVKWSASTRGDGWTLLPAVDQRITLPSEVPPEIVARVTEAYQATKSPLGYVSYFNVAEKSGLSFRQVMEVVRYLVKQGQAHPTVDRMGNNVYFKLKLETPSKMASELVKIAKDLMAVSRTVGAFSVTDNIGLELLEMEALEGALGLIEKTLSSAGLGKFARGNIEVGDYGSFWAAQYKKSSDVILLNAPKMLIRSGKIPRFVALKHLYHEIGHRIFYSLPFQWQAWYESEFESKGKKSVTSYGSTKAQEDFAEIFATICRSENVPPDMLDRFDTVVKKAKV